MNYYNDVDKKLADLLNLETNFDDTWDSTPSDSGNNTTDTSGTDTWDDDDDWN